MADDLRIFLDDVDVYNLENPTKYFETILDLIDNTKYQVILSALYLGISNYETKLIKKLEEAFDDLKRPDFKVTIILDHSRAQRGKNNSITMLSKLNNKYYPRLKVYLYEMPQLRSSFLIKYLPIQLKEVLGVYHCKYCIFDNNIILTGANLSEEYFITRQDRYILIKEKMNNNLEQLSNISNINEFKIPNNIKEYLYQFSYLVSLHCYHLLSNNILQSPTIIESNNNNDSNNNKLKSFMNLFYSQNNDFKNIFHEDHKKHTIIYPIIQHNQLNIHQEEKTISNLLHSKWIEFNNTIISIATPYSNFRLTFLKSIFKLLQYNNNCKIQFITPGISSHGFGSAKGLKGYIPSLHYYSLQYDCQYICTQLKLLQDNHKLSIYQYFNNQNNDHHLDNNNIYNNQHSTDSSILYPNFYYYTKPLWTYHTKGLWIFPSQYITEDLRDNNFTNNQYSVYNESNHIHSINHILTSSSKIETNTNIKYQKQPLNKSIITYIGSSNFNERSWKRDFELGFIIITKHKILQNLFINEYKNILTSCSYDIKNQNSSKLINNMNIIKNNQLPQYNKIQQFIFYTISKILKSFL